MIKRVAFVLGLVAIVVTALIPGVALAFDTPTPTTGLAAKEFYKPELHLTSSNLTAAAAAESLANQGAWDRFAQTYGSPTVYLDPRSGTPTNVILRVPLIPGDGDGNRVALAEISTILGRKVDRIDGKVVGELARKFVLTNREAMAIDTSQLGAAKAEMASEQLWHVNMPQIVDGIPVRYGRVAAMISHGNMVLLGTDTWGNVNLDTHPRITDAQALSIGFAAIGGKAATDELWQKPTLEIIPVAPQEFQTGEAFSGPVGAGYRHRLVWSFGFSRKGEDGSWELLVDAHSGEVLSFEDKNLYETKEITGGAYPLTNTEICPSNDRCGTMVTGLPMPWADTGLSAPNDFTNSAGLFNYTSGTVTTHFNGKFVSITDSCGAVNESASGSIAMGGVNGQHDCTSAGASAGDTPASRSAFYEVNKLKEQARGWLPANAWLQAQLQTNVNLAQTCNAFYSPSAGTINFYRSGGGCRNTGEIAAVFDHEWGHGLDDNDTGGSLSASSEAYADIAAIYRLQASCVGYGFFWTLDDGCGTTGDGTGFNANESQTGTHCVLDCSGVRDSDWDKHADHTPDTPLNFSCVHCSTGGGGPCGRQVHCDAAPSRQAAWDFVNRDLTAAPFNMTVNDAYIVGNKDFYQGSGNIGNWHACSCGTSSDGCGATNAYMGWLAADDDDGNLTNGTPHMTALFAAFNRHGIACATPTPANSGCAGGPTTAPNLTVSVGSNSLSLSWAAVPGASSYRVLRSEGYAGCDFGKAVIANVAGLSYTDPDVANGRDYNYVVQAVGGSSACYGPGSTCVTGTPQPCAGSISLTQDLYNCSGTPLQITLVDGDLTGGGTHTVSISSNTEHGPETATLTENPPNSGVFTGTFNTTTAPASSGDGAISITDGDTIAIDYLDVSYCGTPNVTVTKFATVDCSGPVISNVQVVNITGNSADVTFDTNEPTDAVAHYGTTPPPTSTASNPTLATSHTVHLSGLTGCTAYVISVSATDPAGNSASDDNGGSYYGLITLANVTPTYAYSGPPVTIPDNTIVTAALTVPDVKQVLDVNVKVSSLTHSYDGDLVLTLIGPNGTRILLSNRRGASGDNFVDAVLDDEATTPIASGTAPFTGNFKPDVALSGLDGILANGTWTLEVQDAANADTGTLTAWELQLQFPAEQCPTIGQVALDKTSYQCTETVQIQVIDFSIQNAGTQAVTIHSTTESVDETVVLVETPANSGTFLGSIPLTTGPAVNGDGSLSIANGDSIQVTYIDADDGYGHLNQPRTDTAAIDCVGPVISNVQAQNVTGRTADITWTTDEASSSLANYGTSPPPATPISSGSMVTSHSLHLTGLAPCTTYVFYVSSTDGTGNSTTANNGGAYFSFSTLPDNTPAFVFTGPLAIPDNSTTGASATIDVADVHSILDVNVKVTIAHVNVGDLQLQLVAPNGTIVPLATNRGGTGDNYTNTVFDDSAAGPISGGTAPFTGSFRPENPLSVLNNTLSNGTWTLRVKDLVAANTGSITSWELQLTYPVIGCGDTVVARASQSVSDSCNGGGSNGAADPGDSLSIPVQLANAGNGAATNVTATLTTSTPDVAVVDGSASYGNLAVGQFAYGDAPFLVDVGGSVPCGTVISFQVHMTSNEGSWNDSFTVLVGTPVINTITYNSTDVPKVITDNSTVLSTLSISDTNTVTDVDVTVGNITHSYTGDLALTLIGPNGTRVLLSNRRGSSGDNYVNTVFDDAAAGSIVTGTAPFTGSFKPEAALSGLNGIPANGTWTLEVRDLANADTGSLQAWSLTVTTPSGVTCSGCSVTAPPEVTQLTFMSKTAAEWTAAAGATYYYMYRGEIADLPYLLDASPDSCQRTGSGGLTTGVLNEQPAPFQAWWYLVRGWNSGGYGSVGSGTSGPRIQNSSGACQ